MILENFSVNHRSIADRQLTKILLMSLGCSALLHAVAIAGASYWASNHPDDRIEIVEIERVELDRKPISATKPNTPVAPVIPTPPPQVIKPPTISPTPSPIPAKVSVPSTVIKITKSAAAPTLPQADIISAALKPVAPPVKEATITPPPQLNPTPSFPDRLFSSPAPKSAPVQPEIDRQIRSPKVLPIPTQKHTNHSAPIKDPRPQNANNQIDTVPIKTPPKSALNPRPDPLENPPITEPSVHSTPEDPSKLVPTPDRWRSLPKGESTIPENNQAKSPLESGSELKSIAPNISSTNSNREPQANPQIPNSTPRAAPVSNNQISPNSNQTKPDGINPNPANSGKTQSNPPAGIGGEKSGNNSQTVGGNSKDSQPITPSGSGLNNSVTSVGNSNNDTAGNITTGNKNQSKIQCLKNCEIRYPEELESSDIGKDKILVRVTIDPNGSITNAEIARSSGNQKLDRFTLDGIKKMQLNATGKTRIHKIRISTLLNN